MLRAARSRVIGHLSYYAITDNSERCNFYVYRTTRILYKWLNRKSQRKAYTWKVQPGISLGEMAPSQDPRRPQPVS